jgi:hypothetical protein
MTREYLLTTFLLQTPKRLLQVYFDRRGLLTEFSVGQLKNSDIAPILDGLAALDSETRTVIDADFRSIDTRANANGIQIAMEIAEAHGFPLTEIMAMLPGHHARAMWLFLNPRHGDMEVFQLALTLAEVHEQRFSASRKLRNLPTRTPSFTAETLELLAHALRETYRKQGRGERCHVEHHLRYDPERHYFVAYPEDFSTSDLQYDGACLRRVSRRSAFQVAFIFWPETGLLEISGSGSKAETTALQEIFCRIPMGMDGVPERASDRCFRLNGLKSRDFAFPTDPKHGIERVIVSALRLYHSADPRLRITVERDSRTGESVYEWLHRVLNERQVPLEVLNVSYARLKAIWYPDENGRQKSASFYLSYPDGCNLGDAPHHLLLRSYLKRWDLTP